MSAHPAVAGQTGRGYAGPLPARVPTFTPRRQVIPPRASDPVAARRDEPGTYAYADLPLSKAAAGQARRFTRQTLTRWGTDEHTSDDAVTVASELAANAAKAALTPRPDRPAIIFTLHRQPGRITIAVWDNGPGQPQLTRPDPNAENGRGLEVIDHFTRRDWGWWATPGSGGKVVYATLTTPDAT